MPDERNGLSSAYGVPSTGQFVAKTWMPQPPVLKGVGPVGAWPYITRRRVKRGMRVRVRVGLTVQ